MDVFEFAVDNGVSKLPVEDHGVITGSLDGLDINRGLLVSFAIPLPVAASSHVVPEICSVALEIDLRWHVHLLRLLLHNHGYIFTFFSINFITLCLVVLEGSVSLFSLNCGVGNENNRDQ